MRALSLFGLATVPMARSRSTSMGRSWTHCIRRSGAAWRVTSDAWALQQALSSHLATIWREPDRGIWESRRPPRHFTFSKVMAWVAFDRGAKIAKEFGLKGPVERWSEFAKEIHEDVCANGYDEGLGSFVQSYGSKWLDASLLLIPTTGFLPPDDPRIEGTVRAVEKPTAQRRFGHAPRSRGGRNWPRSWRGCLSCLLLLACGRLHADRARGRGATICSSGSWRSATMWAYFRKSTTFVLGRLVGNFPQAFSHIALVNTTHNLVSAKQTRRAARGRIAARNVSQPLHDVGVWMKSTWSYSRARKDSNGQLWLIPSCAKPFSLAPELHAGFRLL